MTKLRGFLLNNVFTHAVEWHHDGDGVGRERELLAVDESRENHGVELVDEGNTEIELYFFGVGRIFPVFLLAFLSESQLPNDRWPVSSSISRS